MRSALRKVGPDPAPDLGAAGDRGNEVTTVKRPMAWTAGAVDETIRGRGRARDPGRPSSTTSRAGSTATPRGWIGRSIPGLAKHALAQGPARDDVLDVTTKTMVEATGRGRRAIERTRAATVRSRSMSPPSSGDIASAVVHSRIYVEFVLLARTGDGWRIIEHPVALGDGPWSVRLDQGPPPPRPPRGGRRWGFRRAIRGRGLATRPPRASPSATGDASPGRRTARRAADRLRPAVADRPLAGLEGPDPRLRPAPPGRHLGPPRQWTVRQADGPADAHDSLQGGRPRGGHRRDRRRIAPFSSGCPRPAGRCWSSSDDAPGTGAGHGLRLSELPVRQPLRPGAESFEEPLVDDEGWNKENIHFWRRDFAAYLRVLLRRGLPGGRTRRSSARTPSAGASTPTSSRWP